jgi:hypothetical protein
MRRSGTKHSPPAIWPIEEFYDVTSVKPDTRLSGLFIRSDELCFVRRDQPMQYYRIYVRLKSGGQATGRELHNGPPPDHSTVLKVPLVSGRTVKARIGPAHTERAMRRKGSAFTVITEVDADEI